MMPHSGVSSVLALVLYRAGIGANT